MKSLMTLNAYTAALIEIIVGEGGHCIEHSLKLGNNLKG